MMDDNEWRDRLEALQARVKQEPDNGRAWLEYADFLQDECWNGKKTLRAFQRAAELLPELDLRLSLGTALVDAYHDEEGLAMLREKLAENPTSHGYCILARALRKLDRGEEVQRMLEKAIALDPEFEEPYYLMAVACQESSPAKAVRYYRKALDLDPDYQCAWRDLGAVLIRERQTLAEGNASLERATSLDPEDGFAWVWLAIGLAKAGCQERAEKCHLRSIEELPDDPQMKRSYAYFLRRCGREEEAREMEAKAARDPEEE